MAIIGLMTLVVTGCSARHSLNEEEWSQLIKMPESNTETAKELVSRDAQSRQQWLELHEDLQTERTEIGHQRDLLEEDRRIWADRDRRDPMIAEAIGSAGVLLACSLPLLMVTLLLWPRKREEDDVVTEVAVTDLLKDVPRRITSRPARRRLTDQREDRSS